MSTRLRQVVLAAHDRAPIAWEIKTELGVQEGFEDPGVAAFGLENVVFAAGDCFVEVVAPVQDGTTAGRLLSKDGPGGYMAIFQTDDLPSVRSRVDGLGIRIVWEAQLDDIAAMHLHPKDVPGAIVSVDQPEPPQSWRWGGPLWIGQDVVAPPGGLRGLTIRSHDPEKDAKRWAAVLGESAEDGVMILDDGRQTIRFVGLSDGERPGITEVDVELPGMAPRSVAIGGALFNITG